MSDVKKVLQLAEEISSLKRMLADKENELSMYLASPEPKARKARKSVKGWTSYKRKKHGQRLKERWLRYTPEQREFRLRKLKDARERRKTLHGGG